MHENVHDDPTWLNRVEQTYPVVAITAVESAARKPARFADAAEGD